MRQTAKDSHIAYAPVYENDILPNQQKIETDLEKADKLLKIKGALNAPFL